MTFGLIRRIFCLDDYFRKERLSKLIKHSFVGGFALAIWSTGVMYGAQMDSLFTSFLIGYSFSVTVSTITLLIGAAYLKQLVTSRNQAKIEEKLDENIEAAAQDFEPSKFKPHDKKADEDSESPMHISFRQKTGLTIFMAGIIIIIGSNILFSEGTHSPVATRLVGIFISVLSSFFGVMFHWTFAYYAKKNLYRIIEFLM